MSVLGCLDDVLDAVLKTLEKLCVDGEFYGVLTRSLRAEVSRGRVSRVLARENIAYGVRVDAGGGRIASVDSGDTRVCEVQGIVEKAYRIARFREPLPGWRGFSRGYSIYYRPRVFDKRISSMSQDELTSMLTELMDACVDSAVSSGAEKAVVTGGSVNVYSTRILIGNSYGESIDCEATIFSVNLNIKALVGGADSSFTMSYSSRSLDEEEAFKRAVEAGKLSVRFKSPASVGEGFYNILLTPRVVGYLVSVSLAPAFSALNIQENRSPLKGRVGEEVLSSTVDVIDDPWINWRVGSRGFDDEGIAARRKHVVEKGVFKKPLYDYYTACRENTESTGNGFRASPSAQPTPSFTNLVLRVHDESFSLADIESLSRDYIVIHDIIGYWMSSPVNGDVEATVTHALMVSGGEVKPVKGFVVRGNIYEILGGRLDGSSREYVVEGSIEAPAVMVSGLRVSG